MVENKKGQVMGNLIIFIAVAFFVVLMIGTFIFAYNQINLGLQNAPASAGSVNLTNVSDQTFGKINSAFTSSADLIGILMLFGMVLALMVNGFMMRDRNPPLFFIIDFIITIFAYILAVYISNAYESTLAALPFVSTIAENLNNSSRFMLILPRITIITAALTMIITYAGIPKSQEEQIAGF